MVPISSESTTTPFAAEHVKTQSEPSAWALRSHIEILSRFNVHDQDSLQRMLFQISEILGLQSIALISARKTLCSIGIDPSDLQRVADTMGRLPGPCLQLGGRTLQTHWSISENQSGDGLFVGRVRGAFEANEQFLLDALAPSLRLCLQLSLSVRAERSATDAALDQVIHDSLTGLPNRSLVFQQLKERLERVRLQGKEAPDLAVLFIDLDRFKQINDAHGHLTGDRFLITVAKCLQQCVRSGDLVGRLSGDEFIVVCSDVTRQDMERLAQRIIDTISPPMKIGSKLLSHSASIGIAMARDTPHAECLIENADMAMYRAKARGRGTYAHYDHQLRHQALRKSTLEQELRRALSSGDIIAHFQPIIRMGDQRIMGFEALARWHHCIHGRVNPNEFIQIAEENGMIIDIDDAILCQATSHMARWKSNRQHADLMISVNISVRSLLDPGLPGRIRAALEASGLEPTSLFLEITETMLIKDIQATITAIRNIQALKVRLAIDDFGAGYTSLRHLKPLAIEVLKIDRSFVEGLGNHRQEEAILKAVIGMARALGIHAVAEGIENQRQVEVLTRLGCDFMQGRLFGSPLDARSTQALLAKTAVLDQGGVAERG